ncbi:MAG: 30S ribosomal protein S12 methylthiotransferase RimO [Muribaculaceae bacterium]|nr:30S ribosomal protein S12 methylthiotransferase RimO [Muribaculaceae bacterium]
MKPKVNIITLGCSKNLVDSERVMRMLADAGFSAVHEADDFSGGPVVINTCGFISDAKEESVNTILDACRLKEDGIIDRVYVMGCLAQRYADELPPEIPEVDAWFGKFDWKNVVERLKADYPVTPLRTRHPSWDRKITTPSHHAYLKIAEGCNRFCAFCAIPIITGRYHSRPVDEILAEVRSLVKRGVREFNVIAQDLSSYGRDLPGTPSGASHFVDLLERMSDTEGVEWIRLHYAYPSDFPYEILPVMASRKNICKYLDIAFQHIDDRVLGNMQRHIDAEKTRELLARLRAEVPGIHIRTTLMTGFPGETEEAFDNLMDFVREQRFDRMGAFAYCEEEDTAAARNLTDDIPPEVKQERLDRLMALQEEIALELNRAKIGKVMRVVIDSENDLNYVARTEFDSPEVDPEVIVTKDVPLQIGEFYDVVITDAAPFELFGSIVNPAAN